MYDFNLRIENDVISEGEEAALDVRAFEMPRKITLFRVVMERKLGIDWEHGSESYENYSN